MVTIIICVVSLLFVYMVFLLCLDPLLVKKPGRYQEQTNEEVNLDEQTLPPPTSSVTPELVAPPPPPPPPLSSQLGRQRSILNRVSDEQKKWKGTVQEQRRNIYDRHSMLNWNYYPVSLFLLPINISLCCPLVSCMVEEIEAAWGLWLCACVRLRCVYLVKSLLCCPFRLSLLTLSCLLFSFVFMFHESVLPV